MYFYRQLHTERKSQERDNEDMMDLVSLINTVLLHRFICKTKQKNQGSQTVLTELSGQRAEIQEHQIISVSLNQHTSFLFVFYALSV